MTNFNIPINMIKKTLENHRTLNRFIIHIQLTYDRKSGVILDLFFLNWHTLSFNFHNKFN